MDTTQVINNIDKYNEATRRIKGYNYAIQLHKLYNIDDMGLINMIRQDDKFKKFVRKLRKKYNSIDKDDLKAIIEDILFEIVRNRESIVVNYDQMISYAIKSIDNRCKNYIRDAKALKNGYDKDGNNLVSSLHKYINDLGELPFEDKTSMYEYEEVEIMLSVEQEVKRNKKWSPYQQLILKYAKLIIQEPTISDVQASKILDCDRRQIPQLKEALLRIYSGINLDD